MIMVLSSRWLSSYTITHYNKHIYNKRLVMMISIIETWVELIVSTLQVMKLCAKSTKIHLSSKPEYFAPINLITTVLMISNFHSMIIWGQDGTIITVSRLLPNCAAFTIGGLWMHHHKLLLVHGTPSSP